MKSLIFIAAAFFALPIHFSLATSMQEPQLKQLTICERFMAKELFVQEFRNKFKDADVLAASAESQIKSVETLVPKAAKKCQEFKNTQNASNEGAQDTAQTTVTAGNALKLLEQTTKDFLAKAKDVLSDISRAYGKDEAKECKRVIQERAKRYRVELGRWQSQLNLSCNTHVQ